jgi:hypothetical protein
MFMVYGGTYAASNLSDLIPVENK